MKKLVCGTLLLVLLLAGLFVFTFNVRPVKSAPSLIVVPDDYSTIQAAINAANPGDTIFVRNGVYCEHLELDKAVTLEGESDEYTCIEAEGQLGGITSSGIRITSSNSTLENFNITGVDPSISILVWVDGLDSGCSSDMILNNNFGSNYVLDDLLEIDNSPSNVVTGNQLTVFDSSAGIVIAFGSDNAIIDNNTVTGGWSSMWIVFSNNAIISENRLTEQAFDQAPDWIEYGLTFGAIGFDVSSGDVVKENTLVNNSIGLELGNEVSNCSIFHNNFINNTEQAIIWNYYEVNFGIITVTQINWDNGYPSGGNYWSDYNGTDQFSGPYQNVTGSDRIGDTPYEIDANNTDHYPLMNPWSPHDIAVMETSPLKTFVGKGCSLPITFAVWNLGDFAEDFNVTADAVNPFSNEHCSLGCVEVAGLTPNETRLITVEWNTSGLAYGNYTVEISASPVPGQTNTANNNCTCGTIVVTIPGDINGDGKVNLVDVVTLGMAYGSTSGSPSWNANADIDGDGKVDLHDLMILAFYYGQHFP